MANRNQKLRVKNACLILILVLTLSIGFVSAAGFGSTYLSSVDGKPVMQGNAGEVKSYFIYLQNQGSSTERTKIEIADANDIIQNTLQEYYDVPANTLSNAYPVILNIKIPNDAKEGQTYEIKYYVSYASSGTDYSMVSFGKPSYDKNFYVSAGTPDFTTVDNSNKTLSYENIRLSDNKVVSWFKKLFSTSDLEIGTTTKAKKMALQIIVIAIPLIIIGGGVYYATKTIKKRKLARQAVY